MQTIKKICDVCFNAPGEPCVNKVELRGGIRDPHGALKAVIDIAIIDICPECTKWLVAEMKRVQKRLDKKINYNKRKNYVSLS